jgi:hypothetical protein
LGDVDSVVEFDEVGGLIVFDVDIVDVFEKVGFVEGRELLVFSDNVLESEVIVKDLADTVDSGKD